MAKLTLEELRALRNKAKAALHNRDNSDKTATVIIGMGTCGIAAGAKEIWTDFVTELEARGIMNVTVKQSACMGFCNQEPTVEVRVPGVADTVYGPVTSDLVKAIIDTHLVGKKILTDAVCKKSTDGAAE